MNKRISAQSMAQVLEHALKLAMLDDQDTAAVFVDLDKLAANFQELRSLFPAHVLHAVAVKANPLSSVLRFLVAQGSGLEAASLNEVRLALDAGCPTDRIVFDSPVKTVPELRFALSANIIINADNFQEINRIAELLQQQSSASLIGLRVNPQVGQGRIPCTSVASDHSKFGVPLAESRREILAAFAAHPWLTGLHCHVGSQGCSLEQLVTAAERLMALAVDINAACGSKRVRTLDIGGGLPAPYHDSETTILPRMEAYTSALRQRVPRLFSRDFGLITEFGRHLHANTAFAVSRVEYVKEQGAQRTALIHLGADMFLRKCYQPGHWHHGLSVHDPHGLSKQSPACPQHVAGPLCFAGDYLAGDVMLPRMEPGDWVAVHDVGAYTLAMWSRYNSRSMPKVLGFSRSNNDLEFSLLKEREPYEHVRSFWS